MVHSTKIFVGGKVCEYAFGSALVVQLLVLAHCAAWEHLRVGNNALL